MGLKEGSGVCGPNVAINDILASRQVPAIHCHLPSFIEFIAKKRNSNSKIKLRSIIFFSAEGRVVWCF